jgi:K+-sensing histidine kinase KdpD
MKRNFLIAIYSIFVFAFLAILVTTSSQLDILKYFLLIVLGAGLFSLTMDGKKTTIYHNFNFLFLLGIFAYVIYATLFKGALYNIVSVLFFLTSILAIAMSLYYQEPKKSSLRRPLHPSVKIVEETIEAKPVKPVKKQSAKTTKKSTGKTTKKSAKKASKKATKKTTKKTVKKSPSKKAKPTKKALKNSTKKSSKQSSQAIMQDRNLISFEQDHEVAYILRKNNKRITKANKEVLRDYGHKFKKNSKFAPHNRASFDKYMNSYKVLDKLT